MKDAVNLQLSEIKDGALQAKFEREMSKVLANLLDLNTDPKKKHKIQISLNFETDEERTLMKTEIEVKSTLASQMPVTTNIMFGEDDNGIVANELQSGTIGQTFIDPNDGLVKTDKGEVIDSHGEIIDMQARKVNK